GLMRASVTKLHISRKEPVTEIKAQVIKNIITGLNLLSYINNWITLKFLISVFTIAFILYLIGIVLIGTYLSKFIFNFL
ncbi:MAG: hypothetical protein ACRENZ_10465, partial [Thermodesulfobacteriota bacterium]